MVKVKNISGAPLHFVGMETFKKDEVRDVPEDVAEVLKKSPSVEVVSGAQSGKSLKGIDRPRSMKGVETE